MDIPRFWFPTGKFSGVGVGQDYRLPRLPKNPDQLPHEFEIQNLNSSFYVAI
jgi:hypothetical protein